MSHLVSGLRCADTPRIRDINRVPQDPSESTSFISLLAPYPRQPRLLDELALIPRVCEDLPGNWTYTPTAVTDPDSVRFFQRTRVFTLQHFIRLLAARHQFSEALARSSVGSPGDEVQPILQQITQCEWSY